ncbi:winged helix-turn-helix transcriptional regulator [Candidatus Woesearchaeota archaeon]|nr:winged helix-turn-helix transcriptional regulator [Candidatus Woesearchaeota archaeon]
MKRTEEVYREILYQAEKGNNIITQKYISDKLNISLSNVSNAISPLRRMGAIQVKKMCFHIVNFKKILYHWASVRNLKKDIIYSTRTEKSVADIEKSVPDSAVFTAYSGYRLKYKDAPADYSEVYVYCDDLGEIKKRFPESKNTPNIFVIKKDKNIDKYGKIATNANIFVDLWNLPEWYSQEFLKAMEQKWNIGTR